jgi:nucleotide-binding universal stress UspA family protein
MEDGTIMFKKIILPVDMTDKHQRALEVAGDLAEQTKGEIILLHVIEIIPGLAVEDERDFYDRLEAKANRHLQHLQARLETRKVAVRGVVVYGNRTKEVVHFAAQTGADLIVLTSPHLDPANPGVGFGSLSYKVSMLAACPVLLVK